MRHSSTQTMNPRRRAVMLSLTAILLAATRSPAAPMPDLIVTDFWEQKGTIYFTLENSGDKAAPAGHTAYLSVNGHDVDTAYIAVTIAAGKTYTTSFGKYSWKCTASGQYTLAVRADGTDKVAESNEKNNSRQEIWECDVTAPVITQGPLVMYITETSAKVSWTTDEESDSVVRYGQTPGQYSQTRSSQQMTADHKIFLDSLQPDTLYFFVVESTDAAGNTVQSKEKSFRTLSEQPKLPDLVVTDLWEDNHLIHFRVQNAGDSTAEGGHRAGLYIADRLIDSVRITQVLAASESIESHFEKFYFQCFDAEHELRVAADIDDDIPEGDENNNALDKTLICDLVPLKIVSGPTAQEIGTKSAVITWGTNKASDSTALYDSQSELFGQKAEDQAPVTKHRVSLSNLTAGTVYQFKVRSVDASGQSVTSRPGYFRTLGKSDTQPPRITDMTIVRQDTKFPSYRMEATATDDTGVDRVQFIVDGQLIYTDYSEPYDTVFAPGMIGTSRAEFFQPHPVEVVAIDGANMRARAPGMFQPAYECNEVSAEFELPYPSDKVYIAGETAPSGTEVLIQVHALMWDMNCHSIGSIEAPPGSHAAEMGMVCDPQEVAVRKVTFFVNGVLIDTVPSQPNHTYATAWDASGYPLGTHVIRADITGGDECIDTITREIQIERGETDLDLTRRVWREANSFRISLTVRNLGTLDYSCDAIVDNVEGLQPIAETGSDYAVIPQSSDRGEQCDVQINLFGDGGAVTIHPDRSFTVEYHAVPIQFSDPITYTIGAEAVLVSDLLGVNDRRFDRPCVRTEDGIRLAAEIESAIETADYLIVTNPENCQSQFGGKDGVLSQMAKLAYHRNGVLGYLDNWIPSGFSPPTNASIRDQICIWGAAMASGYLSNGYLLLVGETEILPAWTIDISTIEWSNADPTTQVPLSDLPYADVSGADNVPELIVGRIIGNDDASLIQAMQASLDGGFDRSFGVATSGVETDWEDFVGDALAIHDVWVDQAAAGECMTDEQKAHHWSAHVQKEQLVSGYDYPMSAGEGFLMASVDGMPLAALHIDPASDTGHGATHSGLDLIASSFDVDFECPFNAGDALAVGDLDGDGHDEVVVGSIGTDQIIIGYDPPNTSHDRHPSLGVTLNPGDVITCGRIGGDATDKIVVASSAGGGSVRVYEYSNSGTPRITRVDTLDVPFSANDGFAVGDVNGASAGDEIVVGGAGDDRIYIYDGDGDPIAEIPCDPYTANDGLVVGNLDGDGSDEIGVVIDDTVNGKRRLMIFQNDCWSLDPNGVWQVKNGKTSLVYSRFLHFDGARTTGGSCHDGIWCRDLDGDGKEEIYIARESDDRLYVIDGHYAKGWKDRFMPVLQEIDDQIDIFTMNGHGSRLGCSPFDTDDIGTLSLDAHPVVFASSCNTGNYEGIPDDGFAEKFFEQGAAVYIGSTEVSPSDNGTVAGPALFSQWEPGETAGEAFADYRRNRASSGDSMWRYWAMEYNYYGDPKYGGSATSVAAAAGPHAGLAIAAEPDLPGLNESVTIPSYEVKQVDGKDHVTIPGGDVVLEDGKPQVPCWKVQWDLPPGTAVQDVRLRQRSGLKSDIGLVLPTTTMRVDAGSISLPPQAAPEPGWYPAKDLDWRLVPNSNGTTTLVVLLYPFFYNSFTTETRFYPQITIDVEIASPDIRVVSLFTDKPVYDVGDAVTVNLLLTGGGQAQDLFADVAIRRYGSDELVAGLPLRRLSGLMGPASFSATWSSRGVLPGPCCAEVTIAGPTGTVLGRARSLFEIKASLKQTPVH